ncbi:MAG: hypothetical protein ABFR89_00115 [Actinomycetota bacterium]
MSGALLAAGWILASLISVPPSVATSPSFAPTTTPGVAFNTDDAELPVLAPGDGLGLAPTTPVRSGNGSNRAPVSPIGGAGLGAVAAAGAVLMRRRRIGGAAATTGPLFVYVPGHGGDPAGFDDLAGRAGIAQSDIRVFDYRWAWPDGDPIEASRRAPTEDAADALGAYLAALGADGRPIYLVGHSKGGAVITEVVSRWDDHPVIAVESVVGAAILDPPIATGPLGVLQSIGWFHGDTADDGLFEPVRCGWTGCTDIRDHLGERSGVEVVIVRNPDAGFTNFHDLPSGVRVLDFDDGGGSLLSRFPNPIAMWIRMGEAHNSVMHSDVVADCIAAEARSAGTCEWPEPRRVTAMWGAGTSGSDPLMR